MLRERGHTIVSKMCVLKFGGAEVYVSHWIPCSLRPARYAKIGQNISDQFIARYWWRWDQIAKGGNFTEDMCVRVCVVKIYFWYIGIKPLGLMSKKWKFLNPLKFSRKINSLAKKNFLHLDFLWKQ